MMLMDMGCEYYGYDRHELWDTLKEWRCCLLHANLPLRQIE